MYYLLLILLYPLALLPLRVLYVLSDGVYFVIYYVLGYRKQVVLDNLTHAFPEKSAGEIRLIMKRFYHSFCDQWIETLKLLTISPKELDRRMTGNWEVLNEIYEEGRNAYLLSGHNFNWEWANVACQLKNKAQFAGFYQPVKNKAFDRLMLRIRKRGGGLMISMKAKKAMQQLQGKLYIIGLIADQNPSNIGASVWLPFMNREAPFFKGPEQLATRAKAAVLFFGTKKIKRGYYHITLHLQARDASQLPSGQITRSYVTFMEELLHAQPENWLWTHKRWKHKKDA